MANKIVAHRTRPSDWTIVNVSGSLCNVAQTLLMRDDQQSINKRWQIISVEFTPQARNSLASASRPSGYQGLE